ncbi:unnamed protein product [Brassicogethes aeneus]|uniref:Cyclic AMP-dependent transcription factor ATF-2 n=1 Tax=Brassicogethes aeneus TaxID=1431903 RepID=A0A9P0AX63_BRAAE|nr:unnamed protein product [Brassicogethes aeneus]
MNDSRKPFACTVKGCEMTFSVEDHLTVHQNKHMLTVNTNQKCDLADQTPTPTRFLRNCDEVGLFQDLQIVNPFDELFKKATESPKCELRPEVTCDDTLHTPHILPHIQECTKKYDTSENSSCISNDFTISIADNCNRVLPTIVIHDESSNEVKVDNINVKNKLKRILLKNNINVKSDAQKPIEKPNEQRYVHEETKEKIREMNRAAQLRCRNKKRLKMKKLEEEMQKLRNENKRLCLENVALKTENMNLKEMLLEKATTVTKNDKPSDPSGNVSYVCIISTEPASVSYPIVQKPSSNNNINSNLFVRNSNIPINNNHTNINNKKSFLVLQNPKHNKSKKFRRIVPKVNSKSDGSKKN